MQPRSMVLAWWIWAVAVVLIIAGAVALASCATPAPLPFCAKWNATVVTNDDGDVIGAYMDVDGIVELHALIKGLAAGTCRLPSQGTPA